MISRNLMLFFVLVLALIVGLTLWYFTNYNNNNNGNGDDQILLKNYRATKESPISSEEEQQQLQQLQSNGFELTLPKNESLSADEIEDLNVNFQNLYDNIEEELPEYIDDEANLEKSFIIYNDNVRFVLVILQIENETMYNFYSFLVKVQKYNLPLFIFGNFNNIPNWRRETEEVLHNIKISPFTKETPFAFIFSKELFNSMDYEDDDDKIKVVIGHVDKKKKITYDLSNFWKKISKPLQHATTKNNNNIDPTNSSGAVAGGAGSGGGGENITTSSNDLENFISNIENQYSPN